MNTQKSLKKVGTHHGRFHADEVMATAILKEIFEIEVIRTRDPKVLKDLDIVYDVGGGEFDHHGIEKEYREDEGIPYAACGLIWRKFGRDVVKAKDPSLSEDDIKSVFEYIDRVLIEGIDALDNGIRPENEEIRIMNISSVISGFNPPWYLDKSEDESFNDAVTVAFSVLDNTLSQRLSVLKAKEKIADAYANRIIPQVIILDTFCPWGEALKEVDEVGEVIFVVYNRKENYAMQTVRGEDGKDKKYLPKSWAGKGDRELAKVTGVKDAVFCHSGRFIAVAESFEGIMKMCELAIKEPEVKEEEGFLSKLIKLISKKEK